jgi:hypothetical protein
VLLQKKRVLAKSSVSEKKTPSRWKWIGQRVTLEGHWDWVAWVGFVR